MDTSGAGPWHAGPSGPNSLCNACGVHFMKMWDDVDDDVDDDMDDDLDDDAAGDAAQDVNRENEAVDEEVDSLSAAAVVGRCRLTLSNPSSNRLELSV